jgi:hypothetical protein
MGSTTRVAAAVTGAVLALGGLGTSSAQAAPRTGGPAWAPAAKAKVHPGVVVTMADVKCVAGYVLTDGKRVFLAVPASCSGVSDGQPTDGCKEAQVPAGVPAKIQGARYKGTLVYSSFTRMQLTGETHDNKCANNALSLVRLDRRDIKRTNPSVPMVGGPTGVAKAQPAAPDLLTVLLGAAPTKAQALSTTSGGWAHTMMVDGEVNNLNVGCPVLTDRGRALGMVSIVPKQGAPGQTSVGDLRLELRALRNTPGFAHVHLAKGTVPYSPPNLAGF